MAFSESILKAAAAVNTVSARHYDGTLRAKHDILDAISLLSTALEHLDPVVNQDRDFIASRAQAHRLLGELYLKVSRFDDALAELEDATENFEQAGGDSEEYGRFLHDYSVTAQSLNLNDLALLLARKSRQVLAPFGNSYTQTADKWIALLEAEHDSASRIRSLRRDARHARRGRQRAIAFQNLAVELSRQEKLSAENAAVALGAMRYAFRKLKKHGSTDELGAALAPALNLYWEGIQLPDWIGAASLALLEQADAEGRLDQVCDALTIRASWLHQRGRTTEALDSALRATARHDEFMLATETSQVRLLTGFTGQFAREIAITIALGNDEAALIAELIESTRLQVVADIGEGSEETPARSRVKGLRPISVDGKSRLASYYTSGIAGGNLSLEAAINAIGGDEAIWWATWLVNGRLYWTVSIAAKWSCGVIPLEAGTPGGDLLERAMIASPQNPAASPGDILTGVWCRTEASEEEISADLGYLLIPGVLRDTLLSARPDRPMSLIVAGNLATYIPYPLLGMRRDNEAKPVRILETAVIRVAAPAILVESVSSRPLPKRGLTYEIGVACVDPAGDLEHSRQTPSGATTILSGYTKAGYPLASLTNLSAALIATNDGEPRIFYYSGHAASSGQDGSADDALVLSNNELLSANHLFGPGGVGFPFPERILLCACQSAGARGAGAGEWLGLGAAIMSRGGRQIIATNWKIWDTEFTASFDLDLAERMRTTSDAARTLRDAQLRALTAWRASSHDFTGRQLKGLPFSARSVPMPLTWASYCCLGVQG